MLFYYLVSLSEQYSALNVFRYLTFRSMAAFLISFVFVLVFQPLFIRRIRKRGIKGQPIREDGPAHQEKEGTPTMGGLVVLCGVLVATLLLADLSNVYVWLVLAVMLGHAGLGFVDDWQKITNQNSKGVSGPTKLVVQTLISVSAAVVLLWLEFNTELRFPFLKDAAIDLGLMFIVFVALVVVGTSNAVNLTDGLDGLAIGPIMTVALTYGIFTYLAGNSKLANYLAIPYVPGVGDVTIILSAIVAAGLGFLWYNTFPAQVFMGDIGALSLGGTLGIIAVLVKQEVVLVVAGGIFVLEAVSVIVQRYSYKLTGKRVFRMAPIHHHFELKGWAEPKIIVRFWIISIVLALVSLTTLKLR